VDTPGIKEFGLIGIQPRELDLHFPEFPVPGRCGFRDCRHRAEPGCAVRTAVESGTVARSRYDSYAAFLTEVEAEARRETDGGSAREGRQPPGEGASGHARAGGPARRGRRGSR
jgi:putative ribosome biogenesis GTPase RsgA